MSPDNGSTATNSRIATHILEGKVFELISETMSDPGKLRGCMSERTTNSAGTTKALHRIAKKIGALDDERRQLNYRYAADHMSGDEFIAASRALDEKVGRLKLEKSKLAAALRSPEHEDFVDASVANSVQTRKRGCRCAPMKTASARFCSTTLSGSSTTTTKFAPWNARAFAPAKPLSGNIRTTTVTGLAG
jgi:hypothetical protein